MERDIDDAINDAINKVYHDFNDCGSIKFINQQLNDGLVGSVEHAKYVLQVWEEHKRLPQNRELVSAFPLMF